MVVSKRLTLPGAPTSRCSATQLRTVGIGAGCTPRRGQPAVAGAFGLHAASMPTRQPWQQQQQQQQQHPTNRRVVDRLTPRPPQAPPRPASPASRREPTNTRHLHPPQQQSALNKPTNPPHPAASSNSARMPSRYRVSRESTRVRLRLSQCAPAHATGASSSSPHAHSLHSVCVWRGSGRQASGQLRCRAQGRRAGERRLVLPARAVAAGAWCGCRRGGLASRASAANAATALGSSQHRWRRQAPNNPPGAAQASNTAPAGSAPIAAPSMACCRLHGLRALGVADQAGQRVGRLEAGPAVGAGPLADAG